MRKAGYFQSVSSVAREGTLEQLMGLRYLPLPLAVLLPALLSLLLQCLPFLLMLLRQFHLGKGFTSFSTVLLPMSSVFLFIPCLGST